ncbi:anhydro-N-acetylmuramic acid kinase [uncultured Flavobacterium sp.]|uniref:anhydro-N-acetylmuramic acid kinase n=1 Tax=uncultured Flavobacterium sp. TaxID=165435 RepID=UPI0025F0BCAA|nr:anhydro-N-acetylmuramic acid kinase [uncultured Flavobacterium sp.]
MKCENYNVIGVMSGTSLDGVDLAHISFSIQSGKWSFKIHEATTMPYTLEWQQRLKAAIEFPAAQLDVMDKEYTVLLSSFINDFINSHNIIHIDAICSHGHTIHHRPHEGYTLQIGNLPEIAPLTASKVICDFRVQDVQMGGQGAPLVPIGDRLLFSDYTFCLNLGGFSNISFENGNNRAAFDICPVNTVLNHYAFLLGHEYDDGGAIAATGIMIPELASDLDNLPFYKLPYPKSLGLEFVKETVIPLMESYDATTEDKMRTFTGHIAKQIAATLKINGEKGKLLVTGGGAYNSFLIDLLKNSLPDTDIIIPDDKTVQYKEALIFGLLGILRMRGEVNVLSSVTGANKDHCSGKIYLP